VTQKNRLENCRESYNILYFFPDDATREYVQQTAIKTHSITDFYMEVDAKFNREYLLEGYLYNHSNGMQTFLITDYLLDSTRVVDCDYSLRYTLINELVQSTSGLKALNNHLDIGIHPVFSQDSENMIPIMQNNFVFASQLCAIEKIENFTKTRVLQAPLDSQSHATETKLISKGQFTDVYDVYDFTTKNHQGILYVKGLQESQKLKQLMLATEGDLVSITCSYNHIFNKWQAV
jgi:hypothetical protein